ncbi:MAG: GDCCVxC domain-containing (seleno)protein [Vicinamibacterales bacterium]
MTCPACGHSSLETMPTDQCVYFHECATCHSMLKPKPGDCCIFCSFGDKRCPFVQDDGPCPDGR